MYPYQLQAGHLYGPTSGDLRYHSGADSLTDLRNLARWQRAYVERVQRGPRMQVTGRFDAPTQAAVVHVQQLAGLPVTGTIDQATWEAVWTVERPKWVQPAPEPKPAGSVRKLKGRNKKANLYWRRYSQHDIAYGADPDAPYWYPGRPFALNERGWHVRMVQEILGIEPTGKFNHQTMRRVKGLQRLHDLPVSGIVDPATARVIDPPPWPEVTPPDPECQPERTAPAPSDNPATRQPTGRSPASA